MSIFRDDVLAGQAICVTGCESVLEPEIANALQVRDTVDHIIRWGPNVLQSVSAVVAKGDDAKVHWHTCDTRGSDQIDEMVDAVRKLQPFTGVINNGAVNFISPTRPVC